MTKLTEGRHTAEFLMSEEDFGYSRDNIKLIAGSGTVKAGTVLGKVTVSGKFKPHAPAASDGSEVACAIQLADAVVPADADLLAAAVTRAAQVKNGYLVYNAATDTQAEKDAVHASLEAVGIVVR